MNMPIIAMTITVLIKVIAVVVESSGVCDTADIGDKMMVIITEINIMSLILMADIIEIARKKKKLAPVDTQTTVTRRPCHVVRNSRTVEYMASLSFAIQCAALYMMWKWE